MAAGRTEAPPPGADAGERPTPRPPSTRARRRERRIAIAAVAIAVAVVAGILVVREQELANTPTAPPGPAVLVALHTNWTLPPGYDESLSFQLRVNATITGGLFGNQGMVVYLFNSTQYAAFNASGTTSPHAYGSGNVTSLRLYVSLPAGPWGLVVVNPSMITTTVVTVTTAVLATASS